MSLYYNILQKCLNQRLQPPGINIFSNIQQGVSPNVIHNPKIAEPQPAAVKVKSETIIECANQPSLIDALPTGVVAKIPVILAELTITLNVHSIYDLPDWTNEIKNIKKRLNITQCKLMQNTNILFIKGLVRKTLQYSVNTSSDCSNYTRDYTVDIPFKCTTTVTFNGIEPAPLVHTSSLTNKYNIPDDFSEFNQISTAFYNELPFCELISSRIVEFTELHNPMDRLSKSVEDKMVIYLTLKILQYRQVAIPPHNC